MHPASFVYGNSRSAGSYLYVCDRYPACNSYVAAHRATRQPMGSLADGELRHKRIQAHRAFDRLWRSGLMTKKEAYDRASDLEIIGYNILAMPRSVWSRLNQVSAA